MITYEVLPPIKYPLVNKFYQTHSVSGRASRDQLIAIARINEQIVGVARLTPKEQRWFLTGVYVEKVHRGKGIARQLISDISVLQHTIYSFPFAHLASLYRQLGFCEQQSELLPNELFQRFKAYRKQGRDIIAMIKNNNL